MQLTINQEATVYVKHERLSQTFLHTCNTHMLACNHMLSLITAVCMTNTHMRSRTHPGTDLLHCPSRDDMLRWSREIKKIVNYSKNKSVEWVITFAKYMKSTWCTVQCVIKYLQATWVKHTQEATEYLLSRSRVRRAKSRKLALC